MSLRKERGALVAAAGVPGVLYLLTLYPGVGGRFNFGDSAKFQFIGEVLGVPHEPGFPQYVVLNFLWTRLPLPGSLAERVILLSAVFGVIAALLFYTLARRLTERPAAAVLATWAVFLGRRIWAANTDAEVYALNLVWVAGVMLLAWEWRRSRRPALLAGLLFAYAVSFGNHPSMIVLLPALVLLIALVDARKLVDPRWIGVAAAAVALGLSQYAYLLWSARSGTPYLENLPRNATLADLPPFLFAQRFQERWFMGGWQEVLYAGLGRVLSEANVQFLLPALLLTVAGGLVLWRRDRRFAAVIALAGLCYAVFAAGYEIPDWQVYCLPAWLMAGWLLAVALDAAMSDAARQRFAVLGVFVAALLLGGYLNFAALRVDYDADDWPLLIEAAGADAVLVTHAERADYHAIQTDNYYRLGLGLGAAHNLRFVSAEEVFYDDALYLDDVPLFVAQPAALQFFEDAVVDVVTDSPLGRLDDWVTTLPPRTVVAVLINEIGTDDLRRQIADALQPLGLGAALRATAEPFYVGLGSKAPLAGIEAAHGENAALELASDDPRVRALLPSPPPGFPVRIGLSAGRIDRRPYSSIVLDGIAETDGRAGMRVLVFEDGGFRDRYVDSAHAVAFAPAYARSGTRDPVRSITVTPRAAFPPAVARNGDRPITRGHPAVEASVIGCRERRVKVVRTFDFAAGGRGLLPLAEFVPQVQAGDWLLIAARGPIPAADRPHLSAGLAAAGIAGADVAAISKNLFAAARIGVADGAHLLIDIAEPRSIALDCGD